MNAKRHRSPASSKFLATTLSIALLYLELLVPLFPSILFISRPRWEGLAERQKQQNGEKTGAHVVFEFIDASRFYLYVDTVYLAALLISFAIYLLAPLHNSQSIISAIENNFSHHHVTRGVIEAVAGTIVVLSSAIRVGFYLVSIIDTAVNGRLRLWRVTKLPPKNQNKVTIDALDQERSPLHLIKASRYTWFTLTALSIVAATFAVAVIELYLQGGSLSGKLIGESPKATNFNLLMLWWWPHQLLALHNPIAATFVATRGVNLSLSPSSEFLSIITSPITLTFSPQVTLLAIQVLLPVVGGVGTYRFARVLGATRSGSLGAGLLFEVSAIIPSTLSGHLDVAVIAIFPIAAAEVVAYIQGRLSRRRALVTTTLFFIASLLTSIGIGVLSLLFIAAITSTTVLAYGIDAAKRFRKIVAGLAAGLIIAAIFDLPNIYYAIFAHGQLNVGISFNLESVLSSSGGHLLAATSSQSIAKSSFLDPIMVLAAILLICVNLLNRRSRAGVIAATLAAASLAFAVGPSFAFGSRVWPGTLLMGHSIAPLPMTIPTSLPGMNLVSQEMLVSIFLLFTSILVGLFASHSLASSKSEHFAVNEGLNYATIFVTTIGVISTIPLSSIGESATVNGSSLVTVGDPSKLAQCLKGTNALLELPPNGNAYAIWAMRTTGMALPTIGASIGYNVSYPQSLLESILDYSSHSKQAYLQTFEHEINASKINSVIVSAISTPPWSSYIAALGSNYHLGCASNTISISRR